MKKLLSLLLLCPVLCFARGVSGGSVYVQGYTKSNGTYVQPYYRSAPDGNFYNNWSTVGNINPYTGKEGTKTENNNVGSGYYNNPYYSSNPTVVASVPYVNYNQQNNNSNSISPNYGTYNNTNNQWLIQENVDSDHVIRDAILFSDNQELMIDVRSIPSDLVEVLSFNSILSKEDLHCSVCDIQYIANGKTYSFEMQFDLIYQGVYFYSILDKAKFNSFLQNNYSFYIVNHNKSYHFFSSTSLTNFFTKGSFSNWHHLNITNLIYSISLNHVSYHNENTYAQLYLEQQDDSRAMFTIPNIDLKKTNYLRYKIYLKNYTIVGGINDIENNGFLLVGNLKQYIKQYNDNENVFGISIESNNDNEPTLLFEFDATTLK
jgi:hypothetical protein